MNSQGNSSIDMQSQQKLQRINSRNTLGKATSTGESCARTHSRALSSKQYREDQNENTSKFEKSTTLPINSFLMSGSNTIHSRARYPKKIHVNLDDKELEDTEQSLDRAKGSKTTGSIHKKHKNSVNQKSLDYPYADNDQ